MKIHNEGENFIGNVNYMKHIHGVTQPIAMAKALIYQHCVPITKKPVAFLYSFAVAFQN